PRVDSAGQTRFHLPDPPGAMPTSRRRRDNDMTIDRRLFLTRTAASAGAFALQLGHAPAAWAAGASRIGVLIPGSKSDHGWMESGYNGVKAAQQRYSGKADITYIENVKFGDMEQALVALAAKNDLVIGCGGQTQASVLKGAKGFPKVRFAIVGPAGTPTANVGQYDVVQAQIGFVAGAVAAMLSKTGAVSYVGGMEIPAIVNTGKEFGNGARLVRPDIKYFEAYTGDFDDVAKGKEAT